MVDVDCNHWVGVGPQMSEDKTMSYYYTITNEGSEPVIIKARNKFVVRALLNDDCELIQKITTNKAKELINRGIRIVK